MSLLKYIEKLQRIYSLISIKSKGTINKFAYKLGIKRRILFQSPKKMREIGVDIKYSNLMQSYYYADNLRIQINLEKTVLENFFTSSISV